jgi:alpha-glucosidase (family GH31 glycosyl hydrolase)
MNCTADNEVWNGAGFGSQPLAHCAWGLVSRAGWALVDDSRSPILEKGWPKPQLAGLCNANATARTACFRDPKWNPDDDPNACKKAGCCYASTPQPLVPLNLFYSQERFDYYGDQTCLGCGGVDYKFVDFQGWLFPTSASGRVELKVFWKARSPGGDNALVTGAAPRPGYTFVRSIGYAWDPSGAQPQNSTKLKLWWNEAHQDFYTTASFKDEQRAAASGYKFVSLLGYINSTGTDVPSPNPVPRPPAAPSCFQRTSNFDWYLFTHGLNYQKALKDFSRIAGNIPLPRRHWLGVSWSRWGNELTQEITYQQVNNLTNAGFPLSTYVFDMNWHLKPHWTGWTWDPAQYPDHKKLLDWLHAHGLAVGANLHDAEGVMSFEKMYPAMARANGIDPATGQTVLFRISNETYADSLSKIVLEPLAKEGIDFWWTDWQQGEAMGVQDCAGLNPTMILNHYRFMNYSSSGSFRGLIHSRWGGLGNHRYVSGFGGDVVQTWNSLKFMIYFTQTATNVLFGYWGHEMMQLQNAPANATVLELFTRVMQFGAFSPIYTNWGNSGCPDNLWEFPPEFLSATRDALIWRMRLLPYRYTLSFIASESALSTLRPMYYHFPLASEAYEAHQQYMMGEEMLVAPVSDPVDSSTSLAPIGVWFPELQRATNGSDSLVSPSSWISLDDPTEVYSGDNSFRTLHYPLSRIPIFVRAGAIIPMLPYKTAATLGSGIMKSYPELEFWVYPPALTSTTNMYEDDGMTTDYAHGEYATTIFGVTRSSECTQISLSTRGTFPDISANKTYTIRLLASTNLETPKIHVKWNDKTISFISYPNCAPPNVPPPGTWCTYSASPYRQSSLYSITLQLPKIDTTSVVWLSVCEINH